jgi:hypothetical protein
VGPLDYNVYPLTRDKELPSCKNEKPAKKEGPRFLRRVCLTRWFPPEDAGMMIGLGLIDVRGGLSN